MSIGKDDVEVDFWESPSTTKVTYAAINLKQTGQPWTDHIYIMPETGAFALYSSLSMYLLIYMESYF